MSDESFRAFMARADAEGFIRYYDRAGNRIGMEEYSNLHTDTTYKRVAQDVIGQLWVSTVWLGLDHGMPWGQREIFETMVFGRDGHHVDWHEFDCHRYSTEAEALAGHEAICAALRVQHSDIVGEGQALPSDDELQGGATPT